MAVNDVLLRLRLQGQQGVQAGLQQTSRIGVQSFAALIAAGGAAGKMLYEIGAAFDDAYDTIRVQTGATGAAFAALQDDVRAIGAVTPSSFADIGVAVAGINARLELTGQPLRVLARDFLNLSRITKTDVATNVRTVTRALGDWDIATGDQSDTLNKFYRASQASGASVSDLAEQVVAFGAPLRQVGFGLDQAIAMFAMFEEAGVNTQTMMPGLKFALKSFYKEGKDPATELTKTFAGIRDGTIKTKDALEIFGQRAGADMVEAVKQGRFELDGLTRSLQNGDTIQAATKDTKDFTEAWQIFKNRVMLELEDEAVAVFEALGDAVEVLPEMIDPTVDAVADLYRWLARHKELLIALGAGITTYTAGIKVYSVAATVAAFATGGWTAAFWRLNAAMFANPVGLTILAIAALTAGFIYAYRNSETFREGVATVGDVLRFVLGTALDLIIGRFSFLAGGISTVLSLLGHIPGFGWAKDAANAIDEARDAMEGFAEAVKGTDEEGGGGAGRATRRAPAKRFRGKGALTPLALPRGLAGGGTVITPGAFTVGEEGTEIVELPRGAAVRDAQSSRGSVGDMGALLAAIERLASRPIVVQINEREIAVAYARRAADEKAFA